MPEAENPRSRPYGKDGDLALVVGFLSEAVAASPPQYYWHPGDFLWTLFQNEVFDAHESVRLWEDGNELLGFALLEEPDGVILQVRPDIRGSGAIEDEILSWAASRRSPETATKTFSLETDTEMDALLRRLGFTRSPEPSFEMLHHTFGDMPRPAPPEGWSARSVGGEEEWERRVNLHREVWSPSSSSSPSRVTLAAYKNLRQAPGYDPNLDIVAAGPDGVFGSYCICWFDPSSRTGLFEPVGTHPAYRRKGLGRVVIAEGIRRLRDLGADSAFVLCERGNEAALRLYESSGFAVVDREYEYAKS